MATTLKLLKSRVMRALVRDEIEDEDLMAWVASATVRLSQELRVADMMTRATIPLSKDTFFLPPDYTALKTVRLTDLDGRVLTGELLYADPSTMDFSPNSRVSGLPQYYTLYGREIAISPFTITNCKLDIRYFREVPPLLNDTDTNFVLDRYPDTYFNLTMAAGHKHYFEENMASARLADALLEVERANTRYENDRFGDGPLVQRPARKMGGRHS